MSPPAALQCRRHGSRSPPAAAQVERRADFGHAQEARLSLRISHETIYRRIRWDKRAGGDLWRHTRIMSKFGRKRYRSHDSRGVLPGKRSIAERPAEVDARRRRGHWEGDTVMGSDMRHCVLTLVERKTGFAIIKKLSARNTDEVTRAATRALRHHCHKFKTLTLDNGTEFHNYAVLEQHFPLKIYFATPYHSWERGSNENLNGLLRQYLPKGTCMRAVTQAQCDHIADDLNNRPRKRFGYDTPAKLYHRN
jgi:IS30 family transposase